MRRKGIIAIDGPAASGKSTTAKLVAEKLGFLYLDTGAMYRALTWKVLMENVDPGDNSRVVSLAQRTRLKLSYLDGKIKVLLDDQDVSEEIRSPEVAANVSVVSAIPEVRDFMVQQQREMGEKGGVVAEGRDIGTVVFPDADLKIFLVASLEERAKRRQGELSAKGIKVELKKLMEEIRQRDSKDSNREVSPLKKAKDAIILDTTGLTIDEQVDFVLERWKRLSAH